MPLNFHGHILPGKTKNLFVSLVENASFPGIPPQAATVLDRISIHADVAHYCYYRLRLYGGNESGSAESVVLRTALWRFLEALYTNWEVVIRLLPVKTVEGAIEELQEMIKISNEYPVMLWQDFDVKESDWVSRTKVKLPSLESIKEFYELPHMRARFISFQEKDFCSGEDRAAEKAYRRALADRNRRLNRIAKEMSRGRPKREG